MKISPIWGGGGIRSLDTPIFSKGREGQLVLYQPIFEMTATYISTKRKE